MFEKNGGPIEDSKFQEYAKIDKDLTMQGKGTGMYQCYCKQRGIFDFGDVCLQYTKDFYSIQGVTLSVAVGILIVNHLIRHVLMKLVTYIGYHIESK